MGRRPERCLGSFVWGPGEMLPCCSPSGCSNGKNGRSALPFGRSCLPQCPIWPFYVTLRGRPCGGGLQCVGDVRCSAKDQLDLSAMAVIALKDRSSQRSARTARGHPGSPCPTLKGARRICLLQMISGR